MEKSFLPLVGLSLKYKFRSSAALLEKQTFLEIHGKELDVAMSKQTPRMQLSYDLKGSQLASGRWQRRELGRTWILENNWAMEFTTLKRGDSQHSDLMLGHVKSYILFRPFWFRLYVTCSQRQANPRDPKINYLLIQRPWVLTHHCPHLDSVHHASSCRRHNKKQKQKCFLSQSTFLKLGCTLQLMEYHIFIDYFFSYWYIKNGGFY